jgi:hypothetical protein
MKHKRLKITLLIMPLVCILTACNQKHEPALPAVSTDTIEIPVMPPTDTAKKPAPKPQPTTTSPAKPTPAKTAKPTPKPAPSTSTPLKNSVYQLKGTFLRVTEGEGFYFHMLDEAGSRRSFFTSDNLPNDQLESFLTDPSMRGRTIEISWRRANRYFPQSGKTVEVEEVVSIAW